MVSASVPGGCPIFCFLTFFGQRTRTPSQRSASNPTLRLWPCVSGLTRENEGYAGRLSQKGETMRCVPRCAWRGAGPSARLRDHPRMRGEHACLCFVKFSPAERGGDVFVGLVVDSIITDHATRPSVLRRSMMLMPNSVLIRLSRYRTMQSSSMLMNPSIDTPAKLRLWKNSCLSLPKPPPRRRCRENSLSRSWNASACCPRGCGSTPATGSGSHGPSGRSACRRP